MFALLPVRNYPIGALTAAFLLGLLLLSAPAAQAAPLAYVADDFLNLVRIVDTADNTLLATVNVGNRGYGAAFNSAGTRAYVGDYATSSNSIGVFDTSSHPVSATIPVGNSFLVAGSFSIAVQLAGTRIATVPLGDEPTAVAINPAGTRVYVVNGQNLSVIDTGSNTVIATVPVGFNPTAVAVHPAGTRVYVTDGSESAVFVIDTASNTVIATVSVGPIFTGFSAPPPASPSGVAVNPNGNEVYVANSGNHTVAVINTASNAVTATVSVAVLVLGPAVQGGTTERPRRPHFIAVNPAGTLVYVQNVATSTVTTINVADPCGAGTTETVGIDHIVNSTTQSFKLALNPNAGPPPPVIGPVPPKLRVTGMEVTQGIQDLANSVLLVSGRRTFVRVYVQSDGPAVPGVTATLNGLGNIACTPGLCPPSGSLLGPLVPVNTVGPRITVRPDPKRSNLGDSFLFELPWEWTNFRSVSLHAVLTADAGPPKTICLGDFVNDPLHEFRPPTFLLIQFIRLVYPLSGTSEVEASTSEQDLSESFIRRTFPVSGLTPFPDYRMFDAGLRSRVEQTADECTELKTADKNMCAHNYITSRLAALEASSGALRLRRSVGGPAGSTQIVGAVDGAYALIPQHPIDTIARFTRGACCTNRIGAGPANVADYAAHEIGHLFGRQHPVQGASLPTEFCGHDAVDPNYPYFFSFIAPPLSDPATALAGFDGGNANRLIPMSHLSPRNTYDNMGYCKPAWISDYTYRNLYSCLLSDSSTVPGITPGCGPAGGAGPAGPQTGDWLLAFGRITPGTTATATFIQTQRVDRIVSVPPRTPGNHSIRLIGAGGVTLADYPFAPEAVEDTATSAGGSPLLSFGHVVPFVAGTQAIQIVDASTAERVIGVKVVSPNPPVISNVALQGTPDPTTGIVTVGWTAGDSDGDPLTFDIFFTRDGGNSLQPLMLGLSGTSIPIDTSRLSGGSAQFRIVATDGVQSAFADSPPFILANKPPVPRILIPGNGTTTYEGQLVNFEGEATDLQLQGGVIPDSALVWTTPGRTLGSGARLSITDLPLGVNVVTLTATNSLGLSAATTARVTVNQSLDQPGPTLTVGPTQIGWHVGVADQLQTAELAIGNSGSGFLTFTAQSNAPWLTLSTSTGNAPLILTLTANPAGFAGGITEEAEVTLTAMGLPGQVLTVPVTLSVGNTFVVGKTKTSIVTPPDTTKPVVTPPGAITVSATEAGGVRGNASAVVAAFLRGGSAVDAVDPAPSKLAPQVGGVDANNTTLFPIGTTLVTFRFIDASGNIGTATANLAVVAGIPKIAGKIMAKGRNASGVYFVDLQVTDTGTGHARNFKITKLVLKTLSGSGTVSYNTALSPALPLTIGNLDAGASTMIRLYLNVPTIVTKFSVTESGTMQDVIGTAFNYAIGQAVIP